MKTFLTTISRIEIIRATSLEEAQTKAEEIIKEAAHDEFIVDLEEVGVNTQLTKKIKS